MGYNFTNQLPQIICFLPVMGHVISLGLDVISSAKMPDYSSEFRQRVKTLTELNANNRLTDWERRHVKAVQLLADG